jgi:DinB superfamily
MRLLEGWSEKIPLVVKLPPLEIEASRPGTSARQLASLLEQISRATLEARKLVLGRSACDLTTRLEPESWSAAECLDHLARTTNAFVPAISKAMAAAPRLRTNRALRTGAIALLLIRHLEPPYRLRYKVLTQLVPQEKDFDSAWSAFEKSQSRLSEAVCSAAALAIDEVKVQCPVYAPVTYNVYGAFRMLAAHERRHLWQIQQILGEFDRRRSS